ncbi:MAG TPA: hypothetical protein VGX21_18465 [Methylomirabilota bacterium]|jgi:hypothetical protein|nr:hypothetical protein [Methylomirabilota bacterium]
MKDVGLVAEAASRRPRRPAFGSGVGSAGLCAILAVLLLRAAAYATPPDPLWIAGIYDGADFDDLLRPIGLLVGVPDDVHIPIIARLGLTAERPFPIEPPGIALSALPAVHSRAPPAS